MGLQTEEPGEGEEVGLLIKLKQKRFKISYIYLSVDQKKTFRYWFSEIKL